MFRKHYDKELKEIDNERLRIKSKNIQNNKKKLKLLKEPIKKKFKIIVNCLSASINHLKALYFPSDIERYGRIYQIINGTYKEPINKISIKNIVFMIKMKV